MLAEGSPVAAVLRRVSPAGIHKSRREVAIERDREGTPPTGENAAHGVAELVLERDAFLLTGVGCDTASLPTSTRFDAERDLRPLVDVASGSTWAGTDAIGGIAVSARVFGLRPKPSDLASVDRRSE